MIDLKKKPVVIVTTLYKKDLSPDQEISIRHLNHYLGRYDKVVVVPRGSGIGLPGFRTIEFSPKYFTSAAANARLISSEEFYSAFSDYEYIMMYEIDCLCFSDQLMDWVSRGYDYAGAPWIKKLMIKKYDFPDAVGNGGFALRRVDSFLTVIRRCKNPFYVLRAEWLSFREAGGPWQYLKRLRRCGLTTLGLTKMIEDRFFSFEAWKYLPSFKKPDVETALHFAFEVGPRECYERIGRRLPFGCHAWTRYDRAFWEPYTLKS